MPRPGRNEDYAIRQLSRVTCRRLMHTCMKRLSAGRVIISIMISIINAGGGWFTALSSIINADLSPPRDDNATLVTRAAASAERQSRCRRSPPFRSPSAGGWRDSVTSVRGRVIPLTDQSAISRGLLSHVAERSAGGSVWDRSLRTRAVSSGEKPEGTPTPTSGSARLDFSG